METETPGTNSGKEEKKTGTSGKKSISGRKRTSDSTGRKGIQRLSNRRRGAKNIRKRKRRGGTNLRVVLIAAVVAMVTIAAALVLYGLSRSGTIGGPKIITVTYETADGNVTEEFPRKTTVATLPVPSREGFAFTGWDTEKEVLEDGDELHALWEKSGFFVTYDASPGTFSDGQVTRRILFSYGQDTYLDPQLDASFDGRDAEQWMANGAEWNLSAYAASESAQDVTVRAIYPEATASIIYMPNGGEGEAVTIEYREGMQVPLMNCMFTHEGMLFEGWSRDENGDSGILTPQSTVYIESNTPVTMYARWTPAAEGYLVIDRVDVSDRSGRVDYSNGVASDNGTYRLYVIGGGGETLAAEVPAASRGTIVFAGEGLYSSNFVIRAVQNGYEVNICDEQRLFRIDDADAGLSDPSRVSIKGVLPHPSSSGNSELAQLGVRQVIYNLYLANFLDPRGGGTVPFEYGGNVYQFSAQAVTEYDSLMANFSNAGYTVTMVLINDRSGANPLIHQTAGGVATTLYMLATTPEALATEQALGAFLAGRYPGVKNWIVGNEIDAWYLWNYMNAGSIEEYVSEYAKGFRAFYAGITGANGNARVYISLSQNWTGNMRGQYRGRDIVDLFAAMNRDIFWHLAYHPYNWPMTDATAWDSNYTSMDFDTHTITMQNICVLTTYMSMNRLRNPDGSRKSIILSEFGYTSAGGRDQDQAASIVYAWRQALKNPYIDAFLLTREMDDAGEVAQGLATGIKSTNGARKTAWGWYAAMGTGDEERVVNEAYAYINR